MTHYDIQYEAQQCEQRKQLNEAADITREHEDYCLICGDKKVQMLNNVCEVCNSKYKRG